MSEACYFSLTKINTYCVISIFNSKKEIKAFNFNFWRLINDKESYSSYLFKDISSDEERINDMINEIIIISKLFHYSTIDNSFQDELFKYNFSSIKFYIIDGLFLKFILDLRKSKLDFSLSKLRKIYQKLLINSYWEKFISQSLDENGFNRFSYLAQE